MRAPIGVNGNIYFAQRVFFNAVFHAQSSETEIALSGRDAPVIFVEGVEHLLGELAALKAKF